MSVHRFDSIGSPVGLLRLILFRLLSFISHWADNATLFHHARAKGNLAKVCKYIPASAALDQLNMVSVPALMAKVDYFPLAFVQCPKPNKKRAPCGALLRSEESDQML